MTENEIAITEAEERTICDRRVTVRLPMHLYNSIVRYSNEGCISPGAYIKLILSKEVKRRDKII